MAQLSANSTSYTNTGLRAGTTYYYRVFAWANRSTSPKANVHATTLGGAPVPTPTPVPTPVASGPIHYVDGACATSGSGATSVCGSSGPFRTITEAVAVIQPGETIEVRGAHDTFSGIYREMINIGTGGRALVCIASSPCIIRGRLTDPYPRIMGSRLYSNWTNLGGTVWSHVLPQATMSVNHNRDDYDPNTIYSANGTTLTPLGYAGDTISSPSPNHWSYDATTHQIYVNVPNPNVIEVPYLQTGVYWTLPTAYVTVQHLSFEATRGSGINTNGSGSGGVQGLVVRDVHISSFPRFGIWVVNGAPNSIFEDLDKLLIM